MLKNKTDNRLKDSNKAKTHQFYELMAYMLDSEKYKLVETKTTVDLVHLESGKTISKDLKTQVARGFLEVNEDNAKYQLDLMIKELESEVIETDLESRCQLTPEEKVVKWFRILAEKEYGLGVVFDNINEEDIEVKIEDNFFYEDLGKYRDVLLYLKERQLAEITEEFITPKIYKEAKRLVYELLAEFKVDYYYKYWSEIAGDLTKYVEELVSKELGDKYQVYCDIIQSVTTTDKTYNCIDTTVSFDYGDNAVRVTNSEQFEILDFSQAKYKEYLKSKAVPDLLKQIEKAI